MKILTIHADFIEFEAKKKAFAAAEENIKEGKQRVNDCLVVFTAVEKRDEADVSAVVQRYAQEIKNVAQQVNAKNIVIYPYAHLSSQLSIPQVAEKVLKEAEQLLKEKFFVARAPFGWYKAFTISCKGHPLSELSREFGVEATTGNTAEKTVEKTVEKEAMATTAQLKREYKDEPFALNEEKLTERDKIKLTTAALFGLAAQKLFPKSKIAALGLNRDRAYIDQENKLNSQQRAQVLKEMEKLTKNKNLRFEEVSRSEDIKKISDYQKEILKDVGHSGKIYRLSNLGLSIPHYSSETVPSLFKENPFVEPNKVQAFHFIDSSSAYWKRNEKNKQMEHNFLSGWSSEEEKQQYLKEQEEAENRSHLKIGKEQGLFVVSDLVGAGMPLLAPKGTVIRNELINFLWDLHKMKGYQQVWTPHLAKEQLYKTSGHWEKFGDELFHVQGKEERFLMKPMNCPHHMQIFSSFSWSYRDLPVRFFEPATIYRDEKSGQLLGLSRVRAITQDDGHIFCRFSQISEEVRTIVGVIHQFYHTLKMDSDYWVRLSVRGEDKSKYLGSDEVWNTAEMVLESAAKELKLPYRRGEGEAAFYGPKLDFMFKDALGREWQLATIQCDFNLPERFNLSYMNEEGKKERVVVIHRAISGSLERFMSILIEHFAGKFPLWLSPVQVKILTVTDRNISFAQELFQRLLAENIRIELDDAAETIGRKVRNAQLEKANYIVTIGDKEVEQKKLAVRSRDGKVTFDVLVEDFIKELKEKVLKREID